MLKVIGGNLLALLVTPDMILWLLEKAKEFTDNKIDDNVYLIVKGAYKNDLVMLKQGLVGLVAVYGD